MVMHGHEPLLSEMLVVASQDPEILKAAPSPRGAKGINLAGMCCTANEILMRHGIPVAGNFLQQELAIVTGAVDAMVVDVQCVMQSLAERGQVLPHQAHHHHRPGPRSQGRCTSNSTSITAPKWPRRSSGWPSRISRTARQNRPDPDEDPGHGRRLQP